MTDVVKAALGYPPLVMPALEAGIHDLIAEEGSRGCSAFGQA
jgi:hypothetical protein